MTPRRPARPSAGSVGPVLALLWITLLLGACVAGTGSVLSPIADRTTTTGEAIDVGVTLSAPAPDAIVLEAVSDAPDLVPAAGLVFVGSGDARSLRITPAPTGTGDARITVIARDAAGRTSTTSFRLDVVAPFGVELPRWLASDGGADDVFGIALDAFGDEVVVGAYNDDDRGSGAGAAYVFRFEDGAWREVVKLTASDGVIDDRFGHAVAIDGDVVMVSARDHDAFGEDSGAVYVFGRDGDSWVEVQKLVGSDALAGDRYGAAIAISGDHALVGADRVDLVGQDSGAVYPLRRVAGTWQTFDRIVPADAATGQRFGNRIDLSEANAVISAWGDGEAGLYAGAAYLFTFVLDGWQQGAKLMASDAAVDDVFGSDVAIDRDRVLVSAENRYEGAPDVGAVYAFRHVGDVWVETGKLIASDGGSGDRFGYAVALHGDHALIGSRGTQGALTGSGAAYVFHLRDDVWSEVQRLTPTPAVDGDAFGASVALTFDHAFVGAYGTEALGVPVGAVHAFER